MTKQTKIRAIILSAGAILFMAAAVLAEQFQMNENLRLFLFLTAYICIGFESFKRFRDHLMEKRFFDEHFLMILATVGAFSIGRYVEANLAMILFQIGVIFEAGAVDRTKKMIAGKIDIRPDFATRIIRGREFKVKPSALKLYNLIVIKPGERVPVDAEVVSGTTFIDTKALTGETMPQEIKPGDKIYSGSINLTGVVEAKVTSLYEDSTVSRIMDMVERAQENRSESESFVTTFGKYYAPVIALVALALMVVPPFFFGSSTENIWIYRGLVVLIGACPAGLVIATPVAFLGGIACSMEHGVLVKGGNYLESLSKADTFIFDKTGTLTEGIFKVHEIKAIGMKEEELLEIAAHVESYSNHPIAQSIRAAYNGRYDKSRIEKVREDAGYGVSAKYEGVWVNVGNKRMLELYDIEAEQIHTTGTVLYVVIDNEYAGYIVISDELKDGAKDTLDVLKEKFQSVLVMLTGDSRNAAVRVAKQLKMDYAYSSLMPDDKLALVEEFMNMSGGNEKVVCVGDGINDAPIIARADVGIAMGALGSSAAIEAADIVLMDDELPRIVDALEIAKETMRVVNQNLAFAVAIKAIVLIMAAVGYITMWGAVFADLGVMLISVVNAAWVLKFRTQEITYIWEEEEGTDQERLMKEEQS